MPTVKRTVSDAILELFRALPRVTKKQCHGMPTFSVDGKVFAHYAVNHHGDGRVALWLNAPQGAQVQYTSDDPEGYFVPPYTGTKGWLGVHVDGKLSWDEVQFQVAEAYLHTCKSREATEDVIPDIEPPNAPVDPVEFDPFNAPDVAEILEDIRSRCMRLPETNEGRQFASPAFKAGKKTFFTVHVIHGEVCVEAWVGKDRQTALIADTRFVIPHYIGHNGWIQFTLRGNDAMAIVEELIVGSYKHFALKRMLNELEANG